MQPLPNGRRRLRRLGPAARRGSLHRPRGDSGRGSGSAETGESFYTLIPPPARPRACLVLASIASGWLAEASIWSNLRRATTPLSGRCATASRPDRVYERREAALEAVGPTAWAARTRLALPPSQLLRPGECERVAVKPHMLARDELGTSQRRRASSDDDRIGRRSGGPLERAAGAIAALPLSLSQVAQRRRPAVADIIGARRACTVAMISSVSMPWR
jgi:hypothetical protein